MKIAYFSDVTYPQVSGVSSHLNDISISLGNRGHKLLILSPKIKGQKSIKNVEYCHLPSVSLPEKFFKDQAYAVIPVKTKKVVNALKKFSPDIIHIQTPYTAGILGKKIAKELNIPFVETFHGYFIKEGFLNFLKFQKAADYLQDMIWKFLVSQLKDAKAVITPSRIAKEDLVNKGLKNTTRIIHNGITIPDNPTLNLKSKELLYLGRISPEKDLDTLVDCFNIATKRIPSDIKLIFVGDGLSRLKLEEKISDLKLNKRIIFTGTIKREEILNKTFFLRFKAFIITSRTENNPISVLEAMSYGLPIISMEGKGMDELVKDTGILVKSGNVSEFSDAIVNILTNDSLATKLSKNSIERAKQYDLEKCVDKLLKLYEEYRSTK